MRVHSEPQEFRIFADGNADARGVDVLVSSRMKGYGERVRDHVDPGKGSRQSG
jgi:hypothetical protein